MSEKKADKIDAGAKSAAAPKKRPPLKIILIVLALAALVGSFAFVKQVSAKGRAHQPKKVEKGPVMTLDEFLVNLADPGGDHFLKVTIGLELDKKKGKTPEGLKEEVAPIRDAILTSLSSKTRPEIAMMDGREKLKGEIKKRVNDALGEDDVQDVYFMNFVTQ